MITKVIRQETERWYCKIKKGIGYSKSDEHTKSEDDDDPHLPP